MGNETIDWESNEECEDDVTSDDPNSHSSVQLVTWSAVWESEKYIGTFIVICQNKSKKSTTEFQISIEELPWFPSTRPADESENRREGRSIFIIACSQAN